ncbi:MAG: thioredoxin-like domain-containing protein [Blastocatellia bacterium]
MKTKSILGAFFFILFSFAVVMAQQVVISGQLVGSDGKAMPKSHVHLKKPATSLETDKDGSYKLTLNQTGLVFLQFTGVNHQSKTIPVFIEGDNSFIKLNIRLSANEYNEDLSDLRLIDDFKNLNPETAKTFQKQADGTYIVEFETKADRVEYEIFGLEKNDRIINGTQSDDYIYDGDGDYRSVIAVKDGKARIVFDPKKLVRSDAKSEITFDDQHAKLAEFAKIYNGMEEREQALSNKISEAVKAGKNPQDIFESYSESDKATLVKERLAKEKDPFLKQVLLLEYFTYYEKEKDNAIALQALNEILPSSPLWATQPYLLSTVMSACKEKDKTEDYFARFLAENKDNDLKANTLLNKLFEAQYSKEDEKAKKYFAILQKDYPTTIAARQAKLQYKENSNVKVGIGVPEFSVVSLIDKKETYSQESLKGKYYLIDFWATWCGPCVGEMGNLHKAYEKFKGKNFEILSLSFDGSPEDVNSFRQGKWKMPWLHTFVESGFQSELAKRFEVVGIPKPVLVDPTGKIIAVEVDLRGEKLEQTLTKVLGD